MRNAVIAMLSLASLTASAQRPWTPATEGWVSNRLAIAEARIGSNTAAAVGAVLTNGIFSEPTLVGTVVLTGGAARAYGGLEAVVESGLALYGSSPDTHGVRGSSGTGGYGVYGTTYSGWAGVAGYGVAAPGVYGAGGVGYPGGWFVGDTGASPAGVATGIIAEAGLDRTQPGLYTPNSVYAHAFYGSGHALTGISFSALSPSLSNSVVTAANAITVTGRQDIAAGAMFSTPGFSGTGGGVDGWALYPDSYQGLSLGSAWVIGVAGLEWRDETKQARADTWGLWMRDIASDLYLSLSGDMIKARDGYKYSHWTGFHRRKSTGTSVYTNAATEDVIVAMHEHEADADAHAGLFLSGPDATNLVMTLGGGLIASSHGVVLGDSTISAYAGGTEVASLLVTAGDRLAGNSVVSLAVPGHTIAQQYTAWTNYTGRATSVWVAVQVGLNDMLPAANVTNVVADYQALINRIRTDAPSAKILVATMTPAKQRYIDLNGSASGLLAYTWWRFLNTSIMGGGTRPVTNVDMRVSSHTDVLNDGAGNLASVYDTGDHVHENTAARTVIAAEWRRALNVAGLLPASAPTWYRDAHMESNIVVSSVSAVNGSATRLAVDDGVSFKENGVRLVAGWTNGVPVLAVNIAGSNYVFELRPANVVTPDTFVPTDLAGLALWHDGADASSMTISNNFVAVWNDKSTNGYHSVQSVLSARGIVSNGVPYFSDYTKGMPLTNAIIQQPFTMFLVAAQTVDAGNLRIIQGASGYDSIFAFRRTTANGVKLGGTQIYNGSLTTNAAKHVGCLTATGGVASLFFDGAKVAEVAAANPFGRAVIGGPNGNLTFDEARAFVCEIVVYNRFLSHQERTLVQRALGKKWSVNINK